MPASDFLVTPPTIARTRSSSADAGIVAQMDKAYTDGAYVSNGKTYKTHNEAQNDAAVYRRAFAKVRNVPDFQVRSRIWGMKGDTLVTDKDKPADWRFGLTVDTSRVKTTRTRNGNGAQS